NKGWRSGRQRHGTGDPTRGPTNGRLIRLDRGVTVCGHRDRDGADDTRPADDAAETRRADQVLLAVVEHVPAPGQTLFQDAGVGDGVGGQVGELVPGQVVLALAGREGGQDALAEGGRVTGFVHAHPQVGGRGGGPVHDVDEPDLAV